MIEHITYTDSLMSRMAVVSFYSQVLTSNHLPLWFKHKYLKHMCSFLYDRCSLYSHAVSESGRHYHIFSPKLIQKRWSLYVHALEVKSSRLTQAFSGRTGRLFAGAVVCHLTLYWVKDQFHLLSNLLILSVLFLGVQNLQFLRNSHFCQARKNYESVKKIFSRSKELKYTSHNACICTAHFIVEKKWQGYVFYSRVEGFCCF